MYLMIYEDENYEKCVTSFDEKFNKSLIPDNATIEEAERIAIQYIIEWHGEDDELPDWIHRSAAVLYKVEMTKQIDFGEPKPQEAWGELSRAEASDDTEYQTYLKLKEKYG